MLGYFKPGDWLTLVFACVLIAYTLGQTWLRAPASELVMRRDGIVVARAALNENVRLKLPGALGDTIIAIEDRRARVVSDPGPRQLCVQQGWLTHAGDIALCLPNRTSIELSGGAALYDSLNY